MTPSPPCGARGRRLSAAFTLLEILVAMSLVVIFLSLGGFAVVTVMRERDATEIVQRLERISRLAVLRASATQRQQVVAFSGAGAELVGSPEVAIDLGGEGGILIRRAGSDLWEPSKGFRWVFPARGFCEPIAIRLTSGSTQAEMTFNPLTGARATSYLDF